MISSNVWIALRFFNLYRLVIAGLFAVLGALGKLPPNFTQVDLRLLTWSASVYLVTAIALQIIIERRRLPFYVMRNALVLLDIAALILFMHASGGAVGGFGILLVVAIAGACLVAAWRAAVAFAALATLAVLAETIIGSLYAGYSTVSYTQAGLLGAALFATAILASTLAEQARRSESLAAERAIALEQLSQLNDHIVQRMRSGIVVLGADLSVVLINESARLGEGTLSGAEVSLVFRLEKLAAIFQVAALASDSAQSRLKEFLPLEEIGRTTAHGFDHDRLFYRF